MDDPVVAPDPATQTTLPEERRFIINRPGNVNYADIRGSYPGCKVAVFADATEVNEFFTAHANLLVTFVAPSPHGIVVLYTNNLSGEDLEEFNEFSRAWSLHQRERAAKREAAKAEAARKQQEAEAETRRLLVLGKKCEEHHAKIEKQLAELKQLRKELKRDAPR